MESRGKHKIYIGLGANLPFENSLPRDTISSALQELDKHGVNVTKKSSYYLSKAQTLNGEMVPDFTNIVVEAYTDFSASELLDLFFEIENQYGRERVARWSARTLDIDLLFYDDVVLPNQIAWNDLQASDDPAAILPEPVVPHPRAFSRSFVVLPLCDIAFDMQHPANGMRVEDARKNLKQTGALTDISKIE